MFKVYLHGSFMNDNFGDFLLCYKITNSIRRINSDIQILSSNVSNFYRNFMRIDSYSFKNILKTIDCAVVGGGGFFGEPNNYKLYWNVRMIIKHAIPIIRLINNNIPVCIIGVGVGPLSFSISRKVVKYIFERADLVSVRDEESLNYLRMYGVRRNIHMNPDWIMSCTEDELLQKRDGECCILPMNTILIHLASRNRGKGSPIDIVLRDIKKLAAENQKFLIITDQRDNGQIERARLVKEFLKEHHVDLYEYNDPFELCRIIHSSAAVITDKLHVGIVATRFGKPSFSIAYHNKTDRFYRQVNRMNYSIPLNKIKEGIVYDWLKNHITERVLIENVVKMSMNNEKLLKDYINLKLGNS